MENMGGMGEPTGGGIPSMDGGYGDSTAHDTNANTGRVSNEEDMEHGDDEEEDQYA